MYQKKLNFYNVTPFLVLLIVAILAIFAPPELSFEDKEGVYNEADIAWSIVCEDCNLMSSAPRIKQSSART